MYVCIYIYIYIYILVVITDRVQPIEPAPEPVVEK